jgi:hypothetical protein
MAHLRPEHLSELAELRAVSNCVVELIGRYEELGQVGKDLHLAIENTFALQDLRGMRTMVRELRAMMAALRPADRAAIEQEVLALTGVTIGSSRIADLKRVARIVKRGRIANENEYHLLRARIDELGGDLAGETETQALQALVDDFAV